MVFVSTWFAFAIALYLLNRDTARTTFPRIRTKTLTFRHQVGLTLVGVIGGLLTGLAGSGMDITCFAVHTLYFRVSEKTATPTSVVNMAISTAIGTFFKSFWLGGVEPQAVDFWLVCVPVVTFGAPIGSWLASYCHRLVLAWFVYVANTVQFGAAVIIVLIGGSYGYNVALSVGSGCVILGQVGVFCYLERLGREYSAGLLALPTAAKQPEAAAAAEREAEPVTSP